MKSKDFPFKIRFSYRGYNKPKRVRKYYKIYGEDYRVVYWDMPISYWTRLEAIRPKPYLRVLDVFNL